MLLEMLSLLNNNKVLWGVTMILLNMGSKYVMADLGKVHERILTNEIAKKVIVFSMFFVATREVTTAFLLTVFYVILVDGILHEKRNFFVWGAKPDAGAVSEEEYKKALEVVRRYERDRGANGAPGGQGDVYANYLNTVYMLRNT